MAFQKRKPLPPCSKVDVTLEGVCVEALSQGWFRSPQGSEVRDQAGVNRTGVYRPEAGLTKSK